MKKSVIKWAFFSVASIILIVVINLPSSSSLDQTIQYLITCSMINFVLAVCAFAGGWATSLTVSVLSPFIVLLLGYGPKIQVVPAIVIADLLYVFAIYFVSDIWNKRLPKTYMAGNFIAVALASVIKYFLLNYLVVSLIGPFFLSSEINGEYSSLFGLIQLYAALIGGLVAFAISPVFHRDNIVKISNTVSDDVIGDDDQMNELKTETCETDEEGGHKSGESEKETPEETPEEIPKETPSPDEPEEKDEPVPEPPKKRAVDKRVLSDKSEFFQDDDTDPE